MEQSRQTLAGDSQMTNQPYRIFWNGPYACRRSLCSCRLFSSQFYSLNLNCALFGYGWLYRIVLATSRPQISPRSCPTTPWDRNGDIPALLEELGLSNKAVYLPSSMRIGNAQALIPLSGDIDIGRIKDKIPRRLIVRWGIIRPIWQ